MAAFALRGLQSLADDDETPMACGACGGDHNNVGKVARDDLEPDIDNGRYCLVECRWCTGGRMTPKQRERWARHKDRLRESGVRRKVDR
jgi:hypothetical protein